MLQYVKEKNNRSKQKQVNIKRSNENPTFKPRALTNHIQNSTFKDHCRSCIFK